MPRINIDTSKYLKKLDITKYSQHLDLEVDENVFLHIKKMTLKTRRLANALKLSSTNNLGMKMIKELRKKGLDPEAVMKDEAEAKKALFDIDLTNDDLTESAINQMNYEKMIVDDCLCRSMHSFTDEEGKEVELTYELLANNYDQEFISYLISEIMAFSEGLSLGK